MHSITDKAEVAIDFPDKAYIGGFGRDGRFEVRAEGDGMVLRLVRGSGERGEAEIHLHHFLLAAVIDDLATALAARPWDDAHRLLLQAAQKLAAALDATPSQKA
jgi:hypothetical protein